ncbi:hypothetical protein Q664_49790 [Archangium violaceum Cb vi76]|uniref:Uncharacterized protein n=2 Tax=Archangium violaceum TaxID=83451 RepID=A0A084SFI1_9BACT|nr:hypothetical protein Q664_49790 [Archangium violaceum Cb vi76]
MDSILDGIAFLLSERLPLLSRGKPDARLTLETARLFRQYGCGLLLSGLDEDGFRDSLRQAATTYSELLKRKQECSEYDQYYLARSKGEPLFDAIAAGESELARNIASRMSTHWMERMEPEEDFHYIGALIGLLQERGTEGELAAFERCLQGGESYRLEAARALATRDAERFEQGLSGMIEEQINWRERQRRSGVFDPYLHKTEAFIFVEGVALIHLARARGMSTRERYPLIPEAALGSPTSPSAG